MLRRLLFPLLSLLFLLHAPPLLSADEPPGQVAISPSMFEVELGARPATRSIRLKNLKKKPLTLKVEVANWTLDRNNELREIPSTAQSIDQWMVINPLMFTIEPGREQVVRFAIRPRVKPDPGEHRAIIYFNEQPGQVSGGGVELLFRLGVGVYAYADPVRREGSLTALTLDRQRGRIEAALVNRGNVHTRLKGNWTIWRKGTFPGFGAMADCLNLKPDDEKPQGFIAAGSMANTPVLPGTERSIFTSLPLNVEDPAQLEVAVAGTVDGKRIEKLFR